MAVAYAKPVFGEEEKRGVLEVLESGMVAAGPRVKEFESRFAEFIGVKHAVAVCNGTAGLHAALLSAGIKPGDKVLTTCFTFIASTNAIAYCGAVPVFVDIDPVTYNIDPHDLERAARENPDAKAVLIVHLYGLSCEMDRILEICERYNLMLIEDCAQSHGTAFRGKKVGSFGKVGVFSFYPTKNMTTGEGGMIVTNDDEVAARARKVINHGRVDRYLHDSLGYNYRMTDLAAAIGSAQLSKLGEFNETRRRIAEVYTREFSGLGWLAPPVEPDGYYHVYHQYVVRVKDRGRFIEWLSAHEIGHSVVYPFVQYEQPIYAGLGRPGLCPNAEAAAREVISLPMHAALTDEQVAEVVSVVKAFRQ